MVLCALVAPSVSSGTPRIAIGAIYGERPQGPSRQLASALCDAYECVPASRVVSQARVDFRLMEEQGVEGYLYGAVTRDGEDLWLALVTPSLEPAITWLLPLTRRGRLASGSVGRVKRDLEITLAVASASPAEEVPSRGLAIGAILGEGRQGISRQLASAFCAVHRCVPRSRVTTAGRVDFGKMDEHGVEGFLFGSVTHDGEDLWLALVTTSLEPSQTWLLPLTARGRLDPGWVEQVKREVESALGVPSAPPAGPPMVAEAPPPPVPPRPAAPPAPLGDSMESPSAPAALAEASRARTPAAEQAAEAAAPPSSLVRRPAPAAPVADSFPSPPASAALVGASRARVPAAAQVRAVPRLEERKGRWLLAAEAGTFMTNRSLSYTGPTPLLRGYQGLVTGPCLSLEVLPVSPLTDHVLLTGIGFFAEYAFSQGLETTAGSRRYLSTFSALDAGLQWRVRPFSSSEFALVPAASYRMQRFAVSPTVPGLPDSRLSGVAGALRIEVPLGEAVTLLLGGSYTRWLSARDLLGDGFFPAGSAYALEADAGVGVVIYGPLSLRALGVYDTTRYVLEVGQRPLYRAIAAGDSQVGGRVTARARF